MGSTDGKARRLLSALGLPEAIGRRKAATLSIGEQQHIATERVLIGLPEIIATDEPTTALDHDRLQDFLDLLFCQIDATKTTLIMLSHDRAPSAAFHQSGGAPRHSGNVAVPSLRAMIVAHFARQSLLNHWITVCLTVLAISVSVMLALVDAEHRIEKELHGARPYMGY